MTYDGYPKSWWKRALGIALAQLVAVQLVLGAAVAVQMVAATPSDAATLCADNHGGTAGDTRQSHGVMHHGLCAVCAFTAHATPLPGAIAVRYEAHGVAHALRPHSSLIAVVAQQHDPRTSQGPPQNA